MAIEPRSLLGRGPAFPFESSATSGVESSEDIDRINQSLFIIFETPKGSRLMLPEFGSDLRKYRFDPLDAVLMEKIRYTITEDIKRWEPRVTLTSIEFLTDPVAIDNNTLYVSISYRLINTSVVGNYVYPYRLVTYDSIESSYN